jgi:hypothetical protein
MTNNELIDKILHELNKAADTFIQFSESEIIKSIGLSEANDIVDFKKTCQFLDAEKIIIMHTDLLRGYGTSLRLDKLGIKILHEYGSYTKYKKSLDDESKEQKRYTKTNTRVNIILAIFTVLGILYGIYFNIKSEVQNVEIKRLKHSIDSLKKVTTIKPDSTTAIQNPVQPEKN